MTEVIQEDQEDNVVSLPARRKALRRGGGDGPTGCWLWTLAPGTEFVTYDKTQQFPWLLRQWCLVGHKRGISYVCPSQTLNDPNTWMPIDPEEFSKAFELRAVTYTDEDE